MFSLFNSTFLFLGILVIVFSLLIIYFESKIREQNHKISSMLSLVSAITEELNINSFKINNIMSAQNQTKNINTFINKENNENKLISVSDEEISEE